MSQPYTLSARSSILLPIFFLLLLITSACTMELLPTDGSASMGSLEEASTEEPAEPAQPAASSRATVSSTAMTADDLAGTTWSLFAYGDKAELQALATNSEVTAEFSADGNFTGNAGCNRFMSSFTVENGLLSVGPVGLTRMLCVDEAIQSQEELFVGALEGMSEGNEFRLIAEQLEIVLSDGTVLVFQAQ